MLAQDQNPVFDKLFTLLGKINYTFTNTESLLIHMIAGLAKVDKETSSIIFLTLNTTRARINLVERLSKRKSVQTSLRKKILEITNGMSQIMKTKNKYNHCIYSFDTESGQASTILMKIFDKKNEINYGKMNHINDDEIEHLKKTIKDIEVLNANIWNFLVANKFPI